MVVKKLKRIIPAAKRIMKQSIIRWVSRVFAEGTIVRNAFNTNYTRRVLIAYLTEPYKNPKNISLRHTNLTESYTAGKVFHDLEFTVDCVHAYSDEKINFENYDVIYGVVGTVMSASFSANNDIARIHYAPGVHQAFAHRETAYKMRTVYNKTKEWMTSSARYGGHVNWGYAVYLSDHVIVLGNEFTLHTYTEQDKQKDRYSVLSAFFFDRQKPDLEHKNYAEAKKHFLWFGSMGLIHKGLDICLDIFLERDDITLHICGAPRKEKEFWKYYDPLIKGRKNIIVHGFVDVASPDFAAILAQCGFVIFPSVSEGGAAALLNVVGNGGLVPVYTRATGVDFCDFGMEIEAPAADLFRQAINTAAAMKEEELKQRTIKGYNAVRENYTLDRYEENLKKIITGALKNKKIL